MWHEAGCMGPWSVLLSEEDHSGHRVLCHCPSAGGSTGLGWKVGFIQSVPGWAGQLPNCQVGGKAQWPYESAMLCSRT